MPNIVVVGDAQIGPQSGIMECIKDAFMRYGLISEIPQTVITFSEKFGARNLENGEFAPYLVVRDDDEIRLRVVARTLHQAEICGRYLDVEVEKIEDFLPAHGT